MNQGGEGVLMMAEVYFQSMAGWYAMRGEDDDAMHGNMIVLSMITKGY